MTISHDILDLLLTFVQNVWQLGDTIGKVITLILNVGTGLFGFQMPSVIGNIVSEGIGIVVILWAVKKNMSLFVIVGSVMVIVMMAGGIFSYFGFTL